MPTLKPCRSCGHQISPAAEACPHCGAPSTAAVIGNIGGLMVGCGCLVFMLVVLLPFVLLIL